MGKIFLLVVMFAVVLVTIAEARVKVIGRGDKMNFDPDAIPANLRVTYELMSKRCIKCHTMERTVIAVLTGKAPITGQPFDRQAVKTYGIKMLRKPDSNMTKQEIRDVVVLLNYLLDENAR
jgi:hypothetical protein